MDRLKWLGAAARATSKPCRASSERPALWGAASTPQARVAQSKARKMPTSPNCSLTGMRQHAWLARRWHPPGRWCTPTWATLKMVHQAAQAGSARSETLPRRIPKPSAKLGQKVRQRAGAREVDPRPSPELETELAASSWANSGRIE